MVVVSLLRRFVLDFVIDVVFVASIVFYFLGLHVDAHFLIGVGGG